MDTQASQNTTSMSRSAKRDRWIAIIADWSESGQTIIDYCRDHNLSVATFHYWKKKFHDESNSDVPAFTELHVTDPQTRQDGAGLWFDFGNGAKLVIDHDFNDRTFKKLMGVLSSC